jgi:hypothetical protein
VTGGGEQRVLALTDPRHQSRRAFNLLWTDGERFQDGVLTLCMRADKGRVDQGGGVIWRARDANNYYIARLNPIEQDLRVYFVKDGKRVQIGGVGDVGVPTGAWFTLQVEQRGARIQCRVDGETLLDVTDQTFPDEGGVGLWTKADAASSFAWLVVSK